MSPASSRSDSFRTGIVLVPSDFMLTIATLFKPADLMEAVRDRIPQPGKSYRGLTPEEIRHLSFRETQETDTHRLDLQNVDKHAQCVQTPGLPSAISSITRQASRLPKYCCDRPPRSEIVLFRPVLGFGEQLPTHPSGENQAHSQYECYCTTDSRKKGGPCRPNTEQQSQHELNGPMTLDRLRTLDTQYIHAIKGLRATSG